MSDIEESILKINKKIKTLERDKERASGRVEQLLKSLQIKFNCEDIEEAKKMLERIEKTKKKLEKECYEQIEEFTRKWGSKLNSEDSDQK